MNLCVFYRTITTLRTNGVPASPRPCSPARRDRLERNEAFVTSRPEGAVVQPIGLGVAPSPGGCGGCGRQDSCSVRSAPRAILGTVVVGRGSPLSSGPALILIVDDELSILALLEDVLHDAGFAVACAQNGREALEQALVNPPALIVTDLMMPIMDGRALAERLRQHPATATIPIVVMSAAYKAQPADRFAAAAPKPFALDTLLASIEQLLV